jgi:hypothetical protein
MAKNNFVITLEHPHTKAVREAASIKKTDTVSLTTICGMMAGIFAACLLMDPHHDSVREIVIEFVKYVGGGVSGGALLGLLLGEIVKREHIHLHLKYRDTKHYLAKNGKKRIKEKDIPQGTFWGEHTLGDNSLLKEYDEWLMRR